MNKAVAILFLISCTSTSLASGTLLGVGAWFWIILASGVVVAITQFLPGLQKFGVFVAVLIAVISVIAVLFGLLAATIGGSTKLNGKEIVLLFSFFLNAVFGITLALIEKKQNRRDISQGT